MKKNKNQRRKHRINKNKVKQMKWSAKNMNKNENESKVIRNGSPYDTEGFINIEDKNIVDTQFFVDEYFNHPNNKEIHRNLGVTTHTAHELGPGNVKNCYQMGPAGPVFWIDREGKFYVHHENLAYIFRGLGLDELEYKDEDDSTCWHIYAMNLVLDGFVRSFLHQPVTDNEWKYKFLDRYSIPMSTRRMLPGKES
jgi:hypothetical protein